LARGLALVEHVEDLLGVGVYAREKSLLVLMCDFKKIRSLVMDN
jgi:hypothetical protein